MLSVTLFRACQRCWSSYRDIYIYRVYSVWTWSFLLRGALTSHSFSSQPKWTWPHTRGREKVSFWDSRVLQTHLRKTCCLVDTLHKHATVHDICVFQIGVKFALSLASAVSYRVKPCYMGLQLDWSNGQKTNTRCKKPGAKAFCALSIHSTVSAQYSLLSCAECQLPVAAHWGLQQWQCLMKQYWW